MFISNSIQNLYTYASPLSTHVTCVVSGYTVHCTYMHITICTHKNSDLNKET